jgi:hypothetical protein
MIKLAQQFGWKSLSELQNRSKVWANPVNSTFRVRRRHAARVIMRALRRRAAARGGGGWQSRRKSLSRHRR